MEHVIEIQAKMARLREVLDCVEGKYGSIPLCPCDKNNEVIIGALKSELASLCRKVDSKEIK